MGLLRRRKSEYEEDVSKNGGYTRSMADRMKRLDAYSYDFDENEAEAVEARLRRIFYGAKVEDE